MAKPHDSEFRDCMEDFAAPSDLAGVVVAARGGGVPGAVGGVIAHHGMLHLGEAVCDGTLTADALGPPASYAEAKLGYAPGSASPPEFGWHPGSAVADAFHPSYLDAKLGYDPSVEAAPSFSEAADPAALQAHLDRNQWQAGWVPAHMPESIPFHDPNTDITWVRDSLVTETIWHGFDNDCLRGELDAANVHQLQADPQYRDAFAHLAGSSGLDVDHTVPGAQACYDATSGALVTEGVHVGTFDYASPGIDGQRAAHLHLDVLPDWSVDHYTPSVECSNSVSDK